MANQGNQDRLPNPEDQLARLKRELAVRLRALRTRLGETQSETAGALGMTLSGYQMYEQESVTSERRTGFPSAQNLVALAEHFGVPLDDLVGRQPRWRPESFEVLMRPEFGVADIDVPPDHALVDHRLMDELEAIEDDKALFKRSEPGIVYFQVSLEPEPPGRTLRYSRSAEEFRRATKLSQRARRVDPNA